MLNRRLGTIKNQQLIPVGGDASGIWAPNVTKVLDRLPFLELPGYDQPARACRRPGAWTSPHPDRSRSPSWSNALNSPSGPVRATPRERAWGTSSRAFSSSSAEGCCNGFGGPLGKTAISGLAKHYWHQPPWSPVTKTGNTFTAAAASSRCDGTVS